MKYVVIGFPKCGQVSLVEYLNKLGHEAVKYDMIWKESCVLDVKSKYPDYQSIVITRDPIQRIWSGFNFWLYHEMMSFSHYLKLQRISRTLGEENPILQSYYYYWIDRVKRVLNPIIVRFEDLIKLPDFPHENKTKVKPVLPLSFRKQLEKEPILNLYKKRNELINYENNFKQLIKPISND